MKPVTKEEDDLVKKVESHVVVTAATSTIGSASEARCFEDEKISGWNRTRRHLCEELYTHEESGRVVVELEDWGEWIVEKQQPDSEGQSQGTSEHTQFLKLHVDRLPEELRAYVWESAVRDALNEATRSLPHFMVREIGLAADGYRYHRFSHEWLSLGA
ncbi:hypothetical protein diail_8754 [Diaporthe ilicicola]|nr:hypothetical protein diail_8754 [Diaporthe ilicicola]